MDEWIQLTSGLGTGWIFEFCNVVVCVRACVGADCEGLNRELKRF